MISTEAVQTGLPEPGQIVHVRSRRWLVEKVEARHEGDSPLVRLACADDDAQRQLLDVYWGYEIDRKILAEEGWANLAARGFDHPRYFSAFLHTIRWNCVTSTDAKLVQAQFRADIKLDAYQIEPLRMALHLPLVNLFIADDTGLGKTIEAGLIARELLLRKKVNTIVVAAPLRPRSVESRIRPALQAGLRNPRQAVSRGDEARARVRHQPLANA